MSHDHCHHQNGCCCSAHETCCHEKSCGHHEHHADFADQLISMADEAWMELLKEKIKEQIKTTSGAQLDQLAKLVTEANHSRWKNKMSLQNGLDSFKNRLADYFRQDK